MEVWPRLSGSRAPVSLHLSAAWLQLHVPGSCWRHAATWPVSTPTQPGPHTASGRTLGTWALVKTPACHSLVTTCHVSRVTCRVTCHLSRVAAVVRRGKTVQTRMQMNRWSSTSLARSDSA